MMLEYEVKIKARIAELTAQRDKFLAEANQQLAAFNGAIGELERLIAPPATSAPTTYSDPENVNLDFTRTGHGANSG